MVSPLVPGGLEQADSRSPALLAKTGEVISTVAATIANLMRHLWFGAQ
jgi:hypothetical protein